uniref:NADH-ubiquinone oxidoreductase chain 6 n=1 Tax=Rodolia quadrimaculata TaxID=2678939 RepID=A0A6B9MYV4_9CUCU|nr:NADH dehydrogenase subunit 6 [Rodolia quadrimaculata]
MSSLIILACLLIFMKHPIMIGLIILMQTISIGWLIGSMNLNFWFSYILILITIGGLLVLFIYMTSLASNEKFNKNWIFFIPLFFIFSFLNWNPPTYKNFLTLESQHSNFNFLLSKFFNLPNSKIIWFIICYLLVTLIAVVNISKNKKNPLRQLYDKTLTKKIPPY